MDFGIVVSTKLKAWKAREIVVYDLQDSYKESFSNLLEFCLELRRINPSTTTCLTQEMMTPLHFSMKPGQAIQSFHSSLEELGALKF